MVTYGLDANRALNEREDARDHAVHNQGTAAVAWRCGAAPLPGGTGIALMQGTALVQRLAGHDHRAEPLLAGGVPP